MLAAEAAPALFRDSRLHAVWDKVRAGQRLSREDGLLLFETEDLHGLGRMADFAKSRLHGDQVFFVLNRYVNPTNVCVLSSTSSMEFSNAPASPFFRARSRTPSRTCWR